MESKKNEILLSFADVRAVCRKSKKKIFLGAILGALLAGLFALMQPVQYTSKGTFLEKSKGDAQMSMDSIAAGLLRGESKERPTKMTIKSRKILEAVVQKLDLQATLQPESQLPPILNKLAAAFKDIPKNLETEYALITLRQEPSLEDPQPDITAKSISYTGEIPLSYSLEFITNDDYVIKEPHTGSEIGKGRLEKPFNNALFSLTVHKASSNTLKGQKYQLNLYPLSDLALKLGNKLHISSEFESKSFLELTIKYPSRNGAPLILNAIMDEYRNHLLAEHHKLLAVQVDYLHLRELEIDRQTAKLIEEQAWNLSAPVHNLELLVSTQQALNKKLLSNELKLKQLQSENHEHNWLYSIDDDTKHLHSLQQKISELQADRQESDAIVAALDRLPPQKQFAKAEGNTQPLSKSFEGIDLETARNLYAAYSQELHEIEGQTAQYQMIASEVQQPAFELSSLSAILKDTISQGIITKANEITNALKEQHNRTSKEIERLEKDLALQKNFLATHLEQTNERLNIKYELLKNQTYSIQQAMVELLKQKIQIGEKHLSDFHSASIEGLKQEEQIIKRQQKELQLELTKMPQQLVSEKLIELHLEANGIILQQIGNLIETKNIADILDTTLSAPFDRALPPIHPNSPHLLLFTLFGALLGSFAAFCGVLTRSVITGITASKENLSASGQHVSGELFSRLDMTAAANLDTLRRLTSYLCSNSREPNTLLLLIGNGTDYSHRLAELLSKRNEKVLIISTSFDTKTDPEELPGLLQYLEGSPINPKILHMQGFDRLAAGGITAYGSELLKSAPFNKLLNQLQKQYDWILLTSKALPYGAEAAGLLADFDLIAVTISNEKLQDLQSLYFEASGNETKKITYLIEKR